MRLRFHYAAALVFEAVSLTLAVRLRLREAAAATSHACAEFISPTVHAFCDNHPLKV
jgi:hypothetical protein